MKFLPCAALALLPAPLFAQLDLTGTWTPVFHEDQPERIPGPELVDYLGIPINAEARQWALSWDPDRLTAPEHQCQVHTVAYIYRGPLVLRIWEERDPVTQDLVAIHQYINNYEQWRTIYMDGRAHPPGYAPHTWMGFSTGHFDGNILTVTTTHIKQGWHRRNGIPSSDEITLTEHFIRHGEHLTHVTVVSDPIYLTEPLIKSQDFVQAVDVSGIGVGGLTTGWLYPCEYVDEAPGLKQGTVQSFMPEENPYTTEFATRNHVPAEAALGGAETMYPEYRLKMRRSR